MHVYDNMRRAPRRVRRTAELGSDVACLLLAVPVAAWLRYDFQWHALDPTALAEFAILLAIIHVLIGAALGLYTGHYNYGSFDEIAGLAMCALGVGALGFAIENIAYRTSVPRSVPIVASMLALVGMSSIRYAFCLVDEKVRRPSPGNAGRALVIGAGDGGRQLITSMLQANGSPYIPVAILDDDPTKQALRIRGVRVAGTSDDLAVVAAAFDADVAILAIPSAGTGVVRRVSELANEAGLRLLVLPSVSELFGPSVGVGDVRPLAEADLLGRREIVTDVDAIASYLSGKRVLVTGAGGSIGSELCRQIYRFAPASLVMVDRDESALHATQLSIFGAAMLDTEDVVVADLRDADRVAEVFARHRPEVVFHAAALKHLPLLEMYPEEGIKTNIRGTMHVLVSAINNDVDRFVNISTDKAADPASVLGYTKRVTERLTSWAAKQSHGTYLSVRFGNVLGSRGSVLTAFRQQIASGGPVTVTDPDVTRYFMTVEEAVRLVVHAGSGGSKGDVFVLDMGEPVRIVDVARRLISESSRRVEIVYTGLRPGEKLHEDLFAADEPLEDTDHPLVHRTSVPPLRPIEVLRSLAGATRVRVDRNQAVADSLRELCTTDATRAWTASAAPRGEGSG